MGVAATLPELGEWTLTFFTFFCATQGHLSVLDHSFSFVCSRNIEVKMKFHVRSGVIKVRSH